MGKHALHAVIVLALWAWSVADAETSSARVLECEGTVRTSGINAPSDVRTGDATEVTATYTLEGTGLVESGGGTSADSRYTLCRTTSTSYVFSDDCHTSRERYIDEWLQVSDQSSVDRFYTEHKNTAFAMNVIVIDRVGLRVNGEQLDTLERTEVDQQKMEARFKPYLISQKFVGGCQLATPKL